MASPDRRNLSLGPVASLVFAAGSLGCPQTQALPVRVVFPVERDDLARIDNVALELTPQGLTLNYPVTGLEFTLELELEPDSLTRTLALYLAEGATLKAWGRSSPFVLAAPPDELAVFVSPPGRLATFPGTITTPDPNVLASPAPGRGMLLLDSDGETALFNVFTLATEVGSTLAPSNGLPDADDGTLAPDILGGVWRIAWTTTLRAFRYDPGSDAWTTTELVGEDVDLATPRPGATHLRDPSGEHLLIFGGGTSTAILDFDLIASDDGTHTVRRLPVALDHPRSGASALYLTRSDMGSDSDDGDGVVIVGGEDPQAPLAYFASDDGGQAFGDPLAWTGLACQQVERGDAAKAANTLRVVCVGGVRDGEATSDGLILNFPAITDNSPPFVTELPALFPEPAPDPRIFADDLAFYAQSGGHWLRFGRDTLTPELQTAVSPRLRGGHSVLLATGATFLVGGYSVEDRAVDRWHVFVPSFATP